MSTVIPAALSPEHEIVTTRRLPFARANVYAAWTHPGLHARWWGPTGFRNTFYDYDVRPGGEWRFTMHGPNGQDYANYSVFEQVVPGELLVFEHRCAPVFRVVATFADEAGGTRLTFRMLFETAEGCAAVRRYAGDANEQNFDRLTEVLDSLAPDAPEYRELMLRREIDASRETVYGIWLSKLADWWCPKPWTVAECTVDLRPGGQFRTLMRGPEAGMEVEVDGVVLEVVPNERIVFTDAYTAGWRTAAKPFITGCFTFEAVGGKTRYTASAMHWTDDAVKQHEAMGFRAGWGAASDQLLELIVAAKSS